jgi:hypothetical protein
MTPEDGLDDAAKKALDHGVHFLGHVTLSEVPAPRGAASGIISSMYTQ